MEHAGSEDVTGVVRGDFDSFDINSLEESYAFDFICWIFDFIDSESIKLLLFLIAHYFSVVLEHDWQEGFCRRWAENGTGVSIFLCEVGKSSTMVEMEVSENDKVDYFIYWFFVAEEGEVGIPPVVVEEHVNAYIEHDCDWSQCNADAGTAYVLACS